LGCLSLFRALVYKRLRREEGEGSGSMDGKIEQCVCIKFCMKLGKSATESLEILHEAKKKTFSKPDSSF
jgi:hypothetical protein